MQDPVRPLHNVGSDYRIIHQYSVHLGFQQNADSVKTPYLTGDNLLQLSESELVSNFQVNYIEIGC